MLVRIALIVAVAVGTTGCPRGGHGPTRPQVTSGERIVLPGAAVALYAYPETIVAYADDDRGAYVVRVAGDAGGDAVRPELAARAGDDVIGEDGYIVRMSASEREAMAKRAGVVAIEPLQPALRRRTSAGPEQGSREVRIDLFADASADEAVAVAAWIASRGGAVRWQGATSIVATLPAEAIVSASRLSPVRWVE